MSGAAPLTAPTPGSGLEDARDLYQEVILRHGRTPRHRLRLEPFDASARGDNPMCGDRVEVRLRCDGGRIAEAAFEARGCAISIASADMMSEALRGKHASEALALADGFEAMVRSGACPDCLGELRALSGVHEYPSRIRCATLAWDALRAALADAGAAAGAGEAGANGTDAAGAVGAAIRAPGRDGATDGRGLGDGHG